MYVSKYVFEYVHAARFVSQGRDRVFARITEVAPLRLRRGTTSNTKYYSFLATNTHGRRAMITLTSDLSTNSRTAAMNSSDWP